MLGHQRKRPGQAAQLIIAQEHGLGAEVAFGHLAHTFGQHQQRASKLVAQKQGQQHGTKYGQEQAEREGADVHAPQTAPGQGALLVLAVGLLHRHGVVHQYRGQWNRDLQVARLDKQPHTRAGHQRHRFDPDILQCLRIGQIGEFVQPFDLPHAPLLAHRAQLLGARALRVDPET